MQRALDIQIRGLGEKALRVSVTYTSLAMLEEARGNAAAARRYAERALKIQIASPNHPWRASLGAPPTEPTGNESINPRPNPDLHVRVSLR